MKYLIILAIASLLSACGGRHRPTTAVDDTASRSDRHTAECTLDYTGTYTGVLPAADCPGIRVELTLGKDGNYALQENYLDRDTASRTDGQYTVDGNLLTLKTPEGTIAYRMEENRLRMLDADLQPVGGGLAEHYVLTKNNNER